MYSLIGDAAVMLQWTTQFQLILLKPYLLYYYSYFFLLFLKYTIRIVNLLCLLYILKKDLLPCLISYP